MRSWSKWVIFSRRWKSSSSVGPRGPAFREWSVSGSRRPCAVVRYPPAWARGSGSGRWPLVTPVALAGRGADWSGLRDGGMNFSWQVDGDSARGGGLPRVDSPGAAAIATTSAYPALRSRKPLSPTRPARRPQTSPQAELSTFEHRSAGYHEGAI